MDEYTTFDDFIAEIKSRDDVDGVVAYRRVDDGSSCGLEPGSFTETFKDVSKRRISSDMDVVALDNSSYEKQWAEAIDRALADAALEAFKNNMRDCITSVFKQDEVSDRHLKWLRAQMNKKIDILDKVIHLSREDVPHEEHSDDSRREAEEEH